MATAGDIGMSFAGNVVTMVSVIDGGGVYTTLSSAAVNNATSQGPSTNTSQLYMGPAEAVITTIIWTLILLTASIGNVLVIVAIFTHPALYIVQNFLLVSLACADILVALLVMPFAITTTLLGEWIFGRGFCLFYITCDVLLCTASILHLVAIALDRFLAIHYPIRYAQTRNLTFVLSMIAGAWIFSGIISIPPLLGWTDLSALKRSECGYVSESGYIIYSSLGSFYIPLIILVTVYLTIFVSARRRLRRRAGGTSPYSVASAPVTPQVDLASMESPDKSDSGGLNGTSGNHSAGSTTGTPVAASGGGGGGGGWALLAGSNHVNHVARMAQAEHRRLHRKFLFFPTQSRCSACQRTQSRMTKEHNLLVTSSFHIIQEDDFSTSASPHSPIVDLTQHHQTETLILTSPVNHHPLSISVQAAVPLPDLLEQSNHHKPATNGSVKKSSSSAHLFVPKNVRPKQLPTGGTTTTTKNASHKSSSGTAKNHQGPKKQLLPNSNSQCVDVKQSLAKRQKISLTRERRAARTLLIVVLVFVICWLPFFVWYVVKPFCDCTMHDRWYNYILWLGFLNSSLNPVIYTIFNLDFRKAFKRIFHRIFYKDRTFY